MTDNPHAGCDKRITELEATLAEATRVLRIAHSHASRLSGYVGYQDQGPTPQSEVSAFLATQEPQ